MKIDREVLISRLRYDRDTGEFVWRKNYRNRLVGEIAGSIDGDGYLAIKVNGRIYRAHHLAWMYVHREWPGGVVDHIDGDKRNNAIANLRDVSVAGNSQNQRAAHRDNANGLLGVDYNKTKGRYRARIQTSGMRVTLGGFDTAEEAHKAYIEAKRVKHETCTI